MTKKQLVTILLLFLWQTVAPSLAIAQQPTRPHREREIRDRLKYDEAIYLVSNYSIEDSPVRESLSLEALLEKDVEGFYFYIKRDERSRRLVLREPDGTLRDLEDALTTLKRVLEREPQRIMTLFLDYYVDIDLQKLFRDVGLERYLLTYRPESGWPTLREMEETNRRLVVFDLRHHLNNPEWLIRLDDFVMGREMGWEERPIDYTDLFERQKRKRLSFYTGLRFLGVPQREGEDEAHISSYARQTPFLIEDFRNNWLSTGKIPNYVLVDRYASWMDVFLLTVRNFRIIRGTVQIGNDWASYVNWTGLNNYTGGEFCFPLEEGAEMELTPSIPGYRVQPASTRIVGEGAKRITRVGPFEAFPIPIPTDLQLYLPFDNEVADDRSGNDLEIQAHDILFTTDPSRGQVASWQGTGRIGLPTATSLDLRNHDFTVSVWLKIPEYIEGKRDYCVIGGKDNAYQKALHFLIRDQKPYMGFFNNDLAGNTLIETGEWYHVVWRYNKTNGEQAIFVNGKLDAISWGRPAYLGADSLYVGDLAFGPSAVFHGSLDDVAIWSRVLGDKEILMLYNQLTDLAAPESERTLPYWAIALAVIAVIGGAAFYSYRVRKRPLPIKEEETPAPQPAPSAQPVAATEPTDIPRNRIYLFGDFTVIDREGNDISSLFTPKLRQLFLVLLAHSMPGGPGGISGSDLSRMVWGESDDKNLKSRRSVSLRKLRKILERMDKVEVQFCGNRYELRLSNSVYCDYLVCLRWLKGRQICSNEDLERLLGVIDRGELFKGESFAWLDDRKSYIANSIVDVLSRFIGTFPLEQDDHILNIADQILLNDPSNDLALAYKIKVLMTRGQAKSARYVYDKFAALYREMYGEPYPIAFDKVDPETATRYD